jgi:hypothetical protein
MNAENSRYDICICCLQIELENDFFRVHWILVWCNHTRSVDTKQLDDGIEHTFVAAGGSETICLLSLSFVALNLN